MTSLPHPDAAGCTLGALVSATGTRFSVWAPNADSVWVTGDFCDWQDPGHALQRGEDGIWSLEVKGAQVGHQYQYRLKRGDAVALKNDPRACAIDPGTQRGVVYGGQFNWTDAGFEPPPVERTVIYELHVGTFNARDGNHSGTFDSVVARLPYLRGLGINAIELLPPAEFPTDRSWGYNTTNPFAVASLYGGAEGLKRLVDAAHKSGIAVIIDMVINHFGPDALDLWQFDGWSENGLGGIYFYNDHRSSTPWGNTRPDYGRFEVRQYLRDAALHWFREFHVDGLRLDATNFVRRVEGYDAGYDLADGWNLLRWINEDIQRLYPGRWTLAEDLQQNEWLVVPGTEGGAGFTAQWDAAFVHPIRQVLKEVDDHNRDMAIVRDALLHSYAGRPFSRVIYTESHDDVANGNARLATEIAPGNSSDIYAQKRTTLGAVLVLTARGIPMLFKGQEFLEQGWFRDDVPLDWSRLDSFRGIQRLYRDLIQLRRNTQDDTRGLTGPHTAVLLEDNTNKILVFHRWRDGGPGDDVVVAVNFSAHPQESYRIPLPRAGRWRVDWIPIGMAIAHSSRTMALRPSRRPRQEPRRPVPGQWRLSVRMHA